MDRRPWYESVKAIGGCLFDLLYLPILCVVYLVTWTLGRVFDISDFTFRTPSDQHFDRIGRWYSKHPGGPWGFFGIVKTAGEDDLKVTIYYSRFQRYKRGQLEKRIFRKASEWKDIPAATKQGEDCYFSWIPKGQLIWISNYDKGTTNWEWKEIRQRR